MVFHNTYFLDLSDIVYTVLVTAIVSPNITFSLDNAVIGVGYFQCHHYRIVNWFKVLPCATETPFRKISHSMYSSQSGILLNLEFFFLQFHNFYFCSLVRWVNYSNYPLVVVSMISFFDLRYNYLSLRIQPILINFCYSSVDQFESARLNAVY